MKLLNLAPSGMYTVFEVYVYPMFARARATIKLFFWIRKIFKAAVQLAYREGGPQRIDTN